MDEDPGQKLERVDERVIVGIESGFGLIDEQPGAWVETKPRQIDGCPYEMARKFVESLGVGGIDGGVIVNTETKVIPTMPPECKR